MSDINPQVLAIASRLSERASLLHIGSLLHMEASRRLLEQGLRDSCHAGISLAMSRESTRLDVELLKIIKQNPTIAITPSSDYQIISSIDTTDTTPALQSRSDFDIESMLGSIESALAVVDK